MNEEPNICELSELARNLADRTANLYRPAAFKFLVFLGFIKYITICYQRTAPTCTGCQGAGFDSSGGKGGTCEEEKGLFLIQQGKETTGCNHPASSSNLPLHGKAISST